MADNNKNEIMILSENDLRSKVYTVRGVQVMLDFELAEIYGYETRYFNRQVRNNIERFEGEDFMFRLTTEEFENLMCKNFTSSWGGRRKLPYAFTEQGIYLLMTVLKGELAVSQSRALVRLFKGMKDYIIENQQLMITQRDYMALARKVEGNTEDIRKLESAVANTVTRADLSDIMKLFDVGTQSEEILVLDGQPFKADEAYQKIYRRAKKSIVVIDDYIGVKTLRHLSAAKKSIKITIVSDNKGRQPLRKTEYDDYATEYPERDITFHCSENRIHDRYIILDHGTADMKVYLCGSSSKDSGNKITTIIQVKDISEYKPMIRTLLKTQQLTLK